MTCCVPCSVDSAGAIDTCVGDPWITVVYSAPGDVVVAAATRPGRSEFDPLHPGDDLADARHWAMMLALTCVGPALWTSCPESAQSFSQLRHQMLSGALDQQWELMSLVLDGVSRPAWTLRVRHGAVAVVARTARGAVALGARGMDPVALQLRTAPVPTPRVLVPARRRSPDAAEQGRRLAS
ncbi:hypothetical protein [Cryptosporangium sp. NPDC051539]|uniref:hypothetical protein n=1 Tax=Cryptosporangium sp. NPDC051539 TaxID=3363962 RepID=UPI00379AF8CC